MRLVVYSMLFLGLGTAASASADPTHHLAPCEGIQLAASTQAASYTDRSLYRRPEDLIGHASRIVHMNVNPAIPNQVLSVGENGRLVIHDALTGKYLMGQTIKSPSGKSPIGTQARASAIFRDGTKAIVAGYSQQGILALHDISKENVPRRYFDMPPAVEGRTNNGQFDMLRLSPDERFLFAADSVRGKIHMWDVVTGKFLRTVVQSDLISYAAVNTFGLSGDARTVFISNHRNLLIIDLESGAIRAQYDGATLDKGNPSDIIESVMTPDGRYVFLMTEPKELNERVPTRRVPGSFTVLVVEVESGKVTRRYRGERARAQRLGVSQDLTKLSVFAVTDTVRRVEGNAHWFQWDLISGAAAPALRSSELGFGHYNADDSDPNISQRGAYSPDLKYFYAPVQASLGIHLNTRGEPIDDPMTAAGMFNLSVWQLP